MRYPPDDYLAFSRINNRLLNTPTPLKHVPIRIYIPSSPGRGANDTAPASFKVVQALIPPRLPNSMFSLILLLIPYPWSLSLFSPNHIFRSTQWGVTWLEVPG